MPNKKTSDGSPREVIPSLCPGLLPENRGTLSGAESSHPPFRQVSWLAGGLPLPGPSHQLADSGLRLQTPLTVALPRRIFTAFPILPGWAPERTTPYVRRRLSRRREAVNEASAAGPAQALRDSLAALY